MKSSPELRPVARDAFVFAAVLLLAALCAAFTFRPAAPDALCAVVTIDGAEADRIPLSGAPFAPRRYTGGGYTLTVSPDGDGVRVSESDCPSQDCVRTGVISRAGQSIVCLPARIVVTLEGAADYDLIAGAAP